MGHTGRAGRRPHRREEAGTVARQPTGHGGRWGPVEDGELIDAASARLLAAGLPRRERLQALRLLGLLTDLADTDGRVRLPLRTLAAEFDLDRDDTERWLDHLYDAEVVDHDGHHVVLQGRTARTRDGLRLEAFLANVAAVQDAAVDQATTGSRPAPARVPEAWPATAGAALRTARPALAVLAAAAVLVALAFVPSLQPSTLTETLAGGTRTETTMASPATVPGDGQAPAATTVPGPPVSGPAATSSPDATAPAPRVPSDASATQPPASALTPCPPVDPSLVILTVSSRLNEDLGTLDTTLAVKEGTAVWEVVVEGAVDNPTTASALVEHFEVVAVVDGAERRVAGPTVVAEGGEPTAWVVTVTAGATPPQVDDVTTVLHRWSWTDPDLAGCRR